MYQMTSGWGGNNPGGSTGNQKTNTSNPSGSESELINQIVREVVERIGSTVQTQPSSPAESVASAPLKQVDDSSPAPQVNGGVGINPKRIPVGVSVRHVHLCQKDLEILFGKGAKLNPMRELYQPGTFAAKETVGLVGPRMRMLEKVRILGPLRDRTQVEIAKTDAIYLGVDAPLRISGDIKGSAPITLVGPVGSIDLPEGCIRAMRHIHMNPKEAEYFGLRNGDKVKLRVGGEGAVVFENMVVRIGDNLKLEVHLDTDEGNVANITCGTDVEIIKD
jgi:putative phosphotransacetylase